MRARVMISVLIAVMVLLSSSLVTAQDKTPSGQG